MLSWERNRFVFKVTSDTVSSGRTVTQASASKVHLLLECAWPFDKSRVPERGPVSQAAEYGVAFHSLMEQRLMSGEKLDPVDALHRHVEEAHGVLNKWLVDNGFSHDVETNAVEHAMAYCPRTYTARPCSRPDDTHYYTDLRDDEVAGTADVIVVPKDLDKPILVLDHKTGMSKDFSQPEKIEQLLLLGVAACTLYKRDRFLPVVLHAPKGSPPYVFMGKELRLSDPEVRAFIERLRLQNSRRGDGSMRPGSWCAQCPVRSQCPAQSADLIEQATKLVEKANVVAGELAQEKDDASYSREERIGRLHLLITRFRELDKRAIDEIRRMLLDDPGLEPVRPDGKVLVMKTREVEGLSKASIVRSLGKVEGEKIIKQLRDAGCIETSERVELHVK